MTESVLMDTDSRYGAYAAEIRKCLTPETRREFYENWGHWFVTPYCDAHRRDFVELMIDEDGADWIPRPCCERARLFDSRTPGKFKEEFRCSGIVALNSKTYFCVKDDEDLEREFPEPVAETASARTSRLERRERCRVKFSSKGLQKRSNGLTYDHYKRVLRSQKPKYGVNTGFKKRRNVMHTYRQVKRGLTYFYGKRKVLDDGVTTVPLDI